mmetsp:Transcript_37494/g.105876  ORF Transcript_37494/g.105876 Transcript_37494/m.105876 type:complete len:237 (-) Transcript_37494:883-1593(-)
MRLAAKVTSYAERPVQQLDGRAVFTRALPHGCHHPQAVDCLGVVGLQRNSLLKSLLGLLHRPALFLDLPHVQPCLTKARAGPDRLPVRLYAGLDVPLASAAQAQHVPGLPHVGRLLGGELKLHRPAPVVPLLLVHHPPLKVYLRLLVCRRAQLQALAKVAQRPLRLPKRSPRLPPPLPRVGKHGLQLYGGAKVLDCKLELAGQGPSCAAGHIGPEDGLVSGVFAGIENGPQHFLRL